MMNHNTQNMFGVMPQNTFLTTKTWSSSLHFRQIKYDLQVQNLKDIEKEEEHEDNS